MDNMDGYFIRMYVKKFQMDTFSEEFILSLLYFYNMLCNNKAG